MGCIARPFHNQEYFLCYTLHHVTGRFLLSEPSIGYIQDCTERIKGAVIKHLSPEVFFNIIGDLARHTAFVYQLAKRFQIGHVIFIKTSCVNGICMDSDINMVFFRLAETCYYTCILNLLFREKRREYFCISPAVLE